MIASVMVYSLIVACLLLAVGGLLDRMAAIARLPRRWIWSSGLLATIALSIAAPLQTMPERAAQLRGQTFRHVGDAARIGAEPESWLNHLRTGFIARVEMGPRAGAWLTATWLFTSLCSLAIWTTAHRTLARHRRTWPTSTVGGVEVFVAPDTGPAVIGLLSPRIVVPAWVLDFDPQSLDLILRHEREHVRANDVWLTYLAGAALVLVPWNPFVWWMASRLRLSVEFDCDARVVRSLGVDDASSLQTYGEVLLNVAARHVPRGLSVTPALIESSSTLGRRIAAMFPGLVRFGAVKIVVAAGAALFLVVLALTVRVPPTAESGSSETLEVERGTTGSLPSAPLVEPRPGVAPAPDAPAQISTPGAAPSSASPVYAIGTPGLVNPVPLRQPRPGYTPDAMRAKIQGIAAVEAVVGTDGRVRDARITRSLDKEFGLDAAALDAARRWEFRPAAIDGRPVPATVTLELQFTIH